jgi:hypothetical protein
MKTKVKPKTKANPWMKHVNDVKKKHPGKSLSEVFELASKTYHRK